MKAFPNLIFGHSFKTDGNMRFYSGEDSDAAVQNRRQFFARQRINPDYAVSAALAHDVKIHRVSEKDRGKIIPNCDGLITDCPDVFLAITAADCAPVFLCDYEQKVIALVHAGWKGTQLGVIAETIRLFIEEYGSNPANIRALIGPHIQQCHFEIQNDVAKKFSSVFVFSRPYDGRLFLNLGGVIRQQLLSAALAAENITVNPECTHCLPEKYFSFRRDKPQKIEAIVAYIGIKKPPVL